jgi:HAD superfamily 5'-nucleotidase-like hydrolase
MTEAVFVNRILNMKKIKYIGIDMDHTLIRYNTKNFEGLVYQYVVDELINHRNYPELIRSLSFNFDEVIRGLIIDSKNGNIIKVSRHGGIRQSCHGTQPIEHADQNMFYRSTYVDLNDPNYMVIDTSFSIALCLLYAQLVDLKDKYPHDFHNYNVIASDVLSAVDKVHADGKLKKYISEHMAEFVLKDPNLVEGIRRYIRHGKKIFIVTNSDYNYTRLLLDYAITPFLQEGESWRDLFEYVITLSDKPRFFYDKIRFLKVDPVTGCMTNFTGPLTPGVYQGGNATKFSEDLKLQGDEILYIGDHIYGDILRLKKHCNWRTALVVDELGAEITGQKKALPIEREIVDSMKYKQALEAEYVPLYTECIADGTKQDNKKLEALLEKITEIDHKISNLLLKQHAIFNLKWDRVFRTGAEESYFAYQVERYACIYMEKLSDLFDQSPLTYFRARRRLLPHDFEV